MASKQMLAAAGAAAGTAVFVAGTGVAGADQWRDTQTTFGGWADCTVTTFNFFNAADSHMQIRCNVWDTDAEGDSLYVDWYHDGFPINRNEGPVDQNFNFSAEADGDLIIGEIGWRVCRNDFPFGDPCSGFRVYHPDRVK